MITLQSQNTFQVHLIGMLDSSIKSKKDPRKQHLSAEELTQVEEQIVENLFDKAPVINLSKLLNLRELIYNEIYTFEFNSFEHVEGDRITNEDFAKSIICYLDTALVPKYWKLLKDVKWEVSYKRSLI